MACKCPECGSNHKEKHLDGNITCRDCGLVLYTPYPYTAGIRLNIPTCDLPKKDRKRIEAEDNIEVTDVKIKDPDNPAKLLDSVLVRYDEI